MDKTDKQLRSIRRAQLPLLGQAPRRYKRPRHPVSRSMLRILSRSPVGGVYLRRRIHRRREARDFGVAGSRQDLETWGPGQSVHDFGAAGAPTGTPANEKGKEGDPAQNPEAANERRLSRRLKKGWIPGRSA
ncbi:MAG: hypothetical protein LQ341_000413 [Variospora aurantia]|nr:MAG: hypothetical protein LQ341_000413 [Variospora aurantia]